MKYEGHAWFRGRFEAASDAADADPVLIVAGVSGVVSAWLNGRQIVENADGATFVKAPLGDALRPDRENLLTITLMLSSIIEHGMRRSGKRFSPAENQLSQLNQLVNIIIHGFHVGCWELAKG